MAATHTRKRQYQPSSQTTLTSYFNRNSNAPTHKPSMSPDVPPEVAAGLLSVGMRVRKSVPEGYKNKAFDPAEYPFPSSTPPTSSAPVRPSMHTMNSRELTPFCGLHKVGGWEVQEIPSSSAPANMQAGRLNEEDDDDMPGLSTSQSTTMSSQRSSGFCLAQSEPVSRKRTYEEEAEDFMDDEFGDLDDEQTQPGASFRPMARMKAPYHKPTREHGVQVLTEDDFEEAAFLVPMDTEL